MLNDFDKSVIMIIIAISSLSMIIGIANISHDIHSIAITLEESNQHMKNLDNIFSNSRFFKQRGK